MRRSFFSLAMLGLVMAFLYLPIVLVVVYGFVPNGITMSFVGQGSPKYLDASDAVRANGALDSAWGEYRRLDGQPGTTEAAWLAAVPKDADGRPCGFAKDAKVGDLRLSVPADGGRPFAFLVARRGAMGFKAVPLSPLPVPASDRELADGRNVYQLWNAFTPVGEFVDSTWRIGTVDAATARRIAKAARSAKPGRLNPGKGTLAKYEKHFFASGPKRFLGLTTKWYEKVFTTGSSGRNELKDLMHSFWLSLIVAGLTTLVSCVIGTTAALALHRWKGRLQSIHHALVYTPLVMPDILIGISLLMLFVAARIDCGFWTILIAHVTLCIPYVAMTLIARLEDFDDRVVEAAYDLGAGPWYTFFKVELPIILPGIVAGGLLAFTLSIDDVVITSFVNGAGTNTFPTYVSSMTKHSRNLPSVFALSTLMLIFTCALAGVSKLITVNSQPRTKGKQQ